MSAFSSLLTQFEFLSLFQTGSGQIREEHPVHTRTQTRTGSKFGTLANSITTPAHLYSTDLLLYLTDEASGVFTIPESIRKLSIAFTCLGVCGCVYALYLSLLMSV